MTDMAMSPLDRLSLFEQHRVAIDRLYCSGKIDACTRRDRLIAARDAVGITNARTTVMTAVEATEAGYRRRQKEASKRRHARKKAAEGSAVHG